MGIAQSGRKSSHWFCGTFQKKNVADALSKWPKIIPVVATISNKTVEVLWTLFARYGLHTSSHNRPQFTSSIFKSFCKEDGVVCKQSAPYHLSTKWEAECFVQSFKMEWKQEQKISRLHSFKMEWKQELKISRLYSFKMNENRNKRYLDCTISIPDALSLITSCRYG